MMYLLDTNIVSELRKASSGKANSGVVSWAKSVAVASQYISSISVLELELGVLLKESNDPKQGAALRLWLEQSVLPAFNQRVIPVDTKVARTCASLHVPHTRPERDSLILATAITHGLVVVTRNLADFKHPGVKAIDPFE